MHRLQVTIHGRGEHTVVFGHGFGTTQLAWDPQVEILKKRCRVVTFNHAGATEQTIAAYQPSRHSRYEGFAEDLLGIGDEFDLQGATYVGHSMGAMIGVIAACAEPSMFSGMVLIGGSARYIRDAATGYAGTTEQEVAELLGGMTKNYVEWANGFSSVAMANPDKPDLAANFATALKTLRPDLAVEVLRSAFYSDYRTEAEQYGRLGLPTLLLQTKSDIAVPLAAAEWLAKATGGDLHLIDAEGHFPHIAAPDAVARELSTFLDRHGY